MWPRWRVLVPAVAGWGLVGCGPSAPPAPASVRGVVTFQGRPLTGGLVVFAPDRERGAAGRAVSATVGPDGGYRLTVDGSERVPAGWYRVAIADPPGVFTEEYGYPRFPAALRRPDRSGLACEARPGLDNVFDFPVEVPQ